MVTAVFGPEVGKPRKVAINSGPVMLFLYSNNSLSTTLIGVWKSCFCPSSNMILPTDLISSWLIDQLLTTHSSKIIFLILLLFWLYLQLAKTFLMYAIFEVVIVTTHVQFTQAESIIYLVASGEKLIALIWHNFLKLVKIVVKGERVYPLCGKCWCRKCTWIITIIGKQKLSSEIETLYKEYQHECEWYKHSWSTVNIQFEAMLKAQKFEMESKIVYKMILCSETIDGFKMLTSIILLQVYTREFT